MPTDSRASILSLNSGSASLAFALYEARSDAPLVLEGEVQRVRLEDGHISARDAEGHLLLDTDQDFPEYEAAYQAVFDGLQAWNRHEHVQVVGHRVVHGGTDRYHPQKADDALLNALNGLVPLAPKHLPQAIVGIEKARAAFPDAHHLACFDTAFHRDLPQVAQMLPLPHRYWEQGLRRMGFHGLSCQSIMQTLRRQYGSEEAEGRVIIAHLGGGASMTALRGGRSIETTMGLTPTGGLMMSTRSGDLDPGLIAYLAQEENLTAPQLQRLVSEEAGLLGVSGISGGIRDLLEQEQRNERAAEAVALFCYHAKKHLGALVAVLGGLDTLVFTGSVGVNAAAVRARICGGLGSLGLHLDAERNAANETVVSREDSLANVYVLESDEERILAQHCLAYLNAARS